MEIPLNAAGPISLAETLSEAARDVVSNRVDQQRFNHCQLYQSAVSTARMAKAAQVEYQEKLRQLSD